MDDPEDELDAFCHARVGETLREKWHLDRVLGIGGMAAVYAATHRNGATAALKVLHPQYAAHPSLRERFLREAYIANKAGHDGVVKVRDDEVDENGSPFLVMELLEGESVADRADRNGARLPVSDAVWVGQELLGILEAAHAQGIVHRDIKPDNIFWTKDNKLKVLDFGIARLREEAPSKRTKTGMVFGTPGYMAPEQALGRWSDVDARTDLWAVAATIFNLLTGESVHEGETDNERLVNAATRPAKSLSSVLRDAPHRLVEVIDRALDFDQSKRYAGARDMRLDLERASAEIRPTSLSGEMRAARIPQAPISSRAVATQLESPRPAARRAVTEVPELQEMLAEVSPAAIANMRDFFVLLEKAMKTRSQYGKGHKEVERRLEVAFASATTSLSVAGEPFAWSIRSYGFTVESEVVWEPKPPLDKVCYRLFSDGIRALGILPGITLPELSELVRILVADASSEVAPEDDFVTLLWDAKFDHVIYEEGDAFAEGDQAERAAFERHRAEVLAIASMDTSDALEDAWKANARKEDGTSAERKRRGLLGAVSGSSAATAAARASGMQTDAPPPRLDAITIDDATRAVMSARLAVTVAAVGERFAGAAAAALVTANRHGEPGLVAAPLRTAIDGMAGPTAATDILAFLGILETGLERFARPEEREPTMVSLVNGVISPRSLAIVIAAAAASEISPDLAKQFGALVRRLDGNHVSAIATVAMGLDPSNLRVLLLGYVTKHARGHEGEIASTFAKGNLDSSLALLKILTTLGTAEARAAAQEATRSPHPLVRIEALGIVEGASGTGMRHALRAMLEDWDPAVRLAALRSIGQHKIKAAGPGLVMRVKSPEFDGLPVEERREALGSLYLLTSSRSETVYIELLADARLVPSEPHEQTRELAAEMLGLRGRSNEAREALEAASRGRWKNSDRVRNAATTALRTFEERADRDSEPPPSSRISSIDLPPASLRPGPPPSKR
jgi:serine/threonine protein kinase